MHCTAYAALHLRAMTITNNTQSDCVELGHPAHRHSSNYLEHEPDAAAGSVAAAAAVVTWHIDVDVDETEIAIAITATSDGTNRWRRPNRSKPTDGV